MEGLFYNPDYVCLSARTRCMLSMDTFRYIIVSVFYSQVASITS
jgi:hypothetical protein